MPGDCPTSLVGSPGPLFRILLLSRVAGLYIRRLYFLRARGATTEVLVSVIDLVLSNPEFASIGSPTCWVEVATLAWAYFRPEDSV
jgi:hypothetical protein